MILLALSLLVCTNSLSSDFRTAVPVRTNFRWMLLGVTVGLSVSAVCCLSIIGQSLLTGMMAGPTELPNNVGELFKAVYVRPSVLSVEELSVRLVEEDPLRVLEYQFVLGRLSTVSRFFLSDLSDRINTERTRSVKKELRQLIDDINSTVDTSCAFFELASNYDSLILHLRDSEQAIRQAITNSASDICEGLKPHKESLRTLLCQLMNTVHLIQLCPRRSSPELFWSDGKILIELMKSFKFSKPIALYNGLIDFLSNKTVNTDGLQLTNSLKVTNDKFDRTCWTRSILLLDGIVSQFELRVGHSHINQFASYRFLALDSFSKRVNASSQLHDIIGPIALRCARDPNSSFGFKLYFEKTFDEPNVNMFVDPDSLDNLIRRSFIHFTQIDFLQLANRLMRYVEYYRVLDANARSFMRQHSHTSYTKGRIEAQVGYSCLIEPNYLPSLENRAVICRELRALVQELIELNRNASYPRFDESTGYCAFDLGRFLIEPIRDILIERNRANRNSSS